MNLGLEVLFRRDDGYHEIRTVLQTVDVWDELRFEPRPRGIELATEHPEVPKGRENLVIRAAELLAGETGTRSGVAIELTKRIPPGKGLGGGSSDAAATLVALNELWGTGLSPRELHRLAAQCGMDVPFFLIGGTALALGRGEEVYPLATEADRSLVLILPEFVIATAEAYRRLLLTKKAPSLKLQYFVLDTLAGRDGLLDLVNDLESATGEHSPFIHGYKQILRELGADGALMSGSGSAVFGIFRDEAMARAAADALKMRGTSAIATRTVTRRIFLERRLTFQSM